jgi:hypothetical protein
METAQHFMLQNTWMLQPRFDVAEVYVCRSKSGDRVQRIRINSSAFDAEE